MKTIAHIESLFPTKFGIPRQAGIVNAPARIVFEAEFRVPEAVRGLDGFEYIWIIWQFSKAVREDWSPTVRPPRLGGNERVGIFATRSPFRPNPIGLSSVKLLKVEIDKELGPVIYVEGADLMDGTPIYDIKPYLPYTDSHPQAKSGFAAQPSERKLEVDDSKNLLQSIPSDLQQCIIEVLSNDPRPQYQDDPNRLYGMAFGNYEIKFKVDRDKVLIEDILPTVAPTSPSV